MPMPCNLERTIIDNLVICYLAPTELLGWLKQTDNSCYGDFRMYRAEGRFHRHYFHLFTDDYRRLGDIYFERYASKGNELYLWLKVENSLLYDPSYLEVIDQLSAQWELEFNGFTSLDLARDFGYDVAARIRKMMRREDLAVMVNGERGTKPGQDTERSISHLRNLIGKGRDKGADHQAVESSRKTSIWE